MKTVLVLNTTKWGLALVFYHCMHVISTFVLIQFKSVSYQDCYTLHTPNRRLNANYLCCSWLCNLVRKKAYTHLKNIFTALKQFLLSAIIYYYFHLLLCCCALAVVLLCSTFSTFNTVLNVILRETIITLSTKFTIVPSFIPSLASTLIP